MVLLCDMSNIESKKANIPGILTEKINAKMDEKSIFFDKKSKFQSACPPLPVNRMSWNLVCGVSITNLTICGADGLNLKKKFFLNNPSVYSID